MFYGIIIKMYSEKGGQHNLPHIHAEYQGEEMVMSLEGELLRGGIPTKKQKQVEVWIDIHQEELHANWKILSEGEKYFRIEPLK
ncbi:MAG: DUF4160 domain-containing protein [Acetobacterium sp.]